MKQTFGILISSMVLSLTPAWAAGPTDSGIAPKAPDERADKPSKTDTNTGTDASTTAAPKTGTGGSDASTTPASKAGALQKPDTADDKLAKILLNAHILSKDYGLSVKLNKEEALLQTYISSNTKDPDKTCKIDSVLLSKLVFDSEKTVLKIRIRFFDYQRTAFREILVTRGDVLAFGSGSLTEEQLLASLTITEGVAPKLQPSKEQLTPSATTETVAIHGSVANCTVANFILYYPKTWTKQAAPAQDDKWSTVLLRLVGTTANGEKRITLRRHVDANVESQLRSDDEYWTQHHMKRRAPERIQFGASRQFDGVEEVVSEINRGATGGNTLGWTERHIFFASNGAVYSLTLECGYDIFLAANKEFNYVLSYMRNK